MCCRRRSRRFITETKTWNNPKLTDNNVYWRVNPVHPCLPIHIALFRDDEPNSKTRKWPYSSAKGQQVTESSWPNLKIKVYKRESPNNTRIHGGTLHQHHKPLNFPFNFDVHDPGAMFVVARGRIGLGCTNYRLRLPWMDLHCPTSGNLIDNIVWISNTWINFLSKHNLICVISWTIVLPMSRLNIPVILISWNW